MNHNEKILSIQGGGDWADASVMYLVIPASMDIKSMRDKYREAGDYHGTGKGFHDWLLDNGARETDQYDPLVVYDEVDGELL